MHEQIWAKCLTYIAEKIPAQSFKTWFQPIKPVFFNDSVLTIQVPSQFFYEWLEDNYVTILKEAITNEIGPSGKLEYSVVVDQGDSQHKPTTVNLAQKKEFPSFGQNGTATKPSYTSPFALPEVANHQQNSNLNPNYTFDSYIEGDCNRLARSAGYAVASKPGSTSFNPLMIYGSVGLGKTHLVQSIGNRIKKENPENFVLYVASEKFASQFIEALKSNSLQDFTNFYLNVDTLIIDDVQFFKDKVKTQEIFFHIFNHLHQNNKQIIMSSDRPPTELEGLQERLVSRFKWGLTADLQRPDFETRLAIIQKKLQDDGLKIDDKVLEYLAYSIDSNIRELEGVLISLVAHASLNKSEIDMELAKQTLKSIVKNIESEVGIDYIQKTVSEYFNVSSDDLKAKTRKKEIVIARQLAMYFSKDYTNHSLKSIGNHFGGRDHSTVIHALQSVNDMLDTDARFRSSFSELKKKFKMKSI
ncbi:chromosomal replication initiator protein DnaA [Reichenbachiella versicolor]|uniref:chromosomal replication initiator protein DnaA n=1 Tax=Reichenbachiella versicolor TaxID=1821036 RepID=UPI000D6E73DE|nr:chromosomal replication initiator protein DnaA [Reichenbachiella versicolor]